MVVKGDGVGGGKDWVEVWLEQRALLPLKPVDTPSATCPKGILDPVRGSMQKCWLGDVPKSRKVRLRG